MRPLLYPSRHHPPPPLVLPLALTATLAMGSSAWCQPTRSSKPAATRPSSTRAAATKPTQPPVGGMPIGVVDEEKLAAARSDYPMLALRVLPQVAARRKLSLIVTTRGLWWGGDKNTKTPRVDVTADVLALLKDVPVTPGALTRAQLGAARRVLDELNALRVVTGMNNVNRTDFNTRLTNTSIVFDASMRQLPTGSLKDQITKAMEGYTHSRNTWEFCSQLLTVTSRTLARTQSRELKATNPFVHHQLKRKHDEEQEKARLEAYQSLFDEWKKVGEEVERANAMMPPTGPVTPQ